MNLAFLTAGVLAGYRYSALALTVTLPLSIACACLAAVIGLTGPGLAQVLNLGVLFEFGFFGGCCLYSLALDKSDARKRFANETPGHSH